MVIFFKNGCIRKKRLCWGKSGCARAKVVVMGQKWFQSGKSGYNRAKVVVFGQKFLYSGNVVVFEQNG